MLNKPYVLNVLDEDDNDNTSTNISKKKEPSDNVNTCQVNDIDFGINKCKLYVWITFYIYLWLLSVHSKVFYSCSANLFVNKIK